MVLIFKREQKSKSNDEFVEKVLAEAGVVSWMAS